MLTYRLNGEKGNMMKKEIKKEAERIVEQWNESYKQNGTYMFEAPKF